jgi:hypothetical protein
MLSTTSPLKDKWTKDAMSALHELYRVSRSISDGPAAVELYAALVGQVPAFTRAYGLFCLPEPRALLLVTESSVAQIGTPAGGMLGVLRWVDIAHIHATSTMTTTAMDTQTDWVALDTVEGQWRLIVQVGLFPHPIRSDVGAEIVTAIKTARARSDLRPVGMLPPLPADELTKPIGPTSADVIQRFGVTGVTSTEVLRWADAVLASNIAVECLRAGQEFGAYAFEVQGDVYDPDLPWRLIAAVLDENLRQGHLLDAARIGAAVTVWHQLLSGASHFRLGSMYDASASIRIELEAATRTALSAFPGAVVLGRDRLVAVTVGWVHELLNAPAKPAVRPSLDTMWGEIVCAVGEEGRITAASLFGQYVPLDDIETVTPRVDAAIWVCGGWKRDTTRVLYDQYLRPHIELVAEAVGVRRTPAAFLPRNTPAANCLCRWPDPALPDIDTMAFLAWMAIGYLRIPKLVHNLGLIPVD